MKFFYALFVFFILAAANVSVFSQPPANSYVAGELIVKFKSNSTLKSAPRINAAMGAEILEEFPGLKLQRVKIPEYLPIETAMAQYAALPEVEYAQPNFYYHLLATPNDPRFLSGEMYGLAKISAPAAWDFSVGSPETVVANIDTGIRYTHEDLAANVWTNAGEINNNGVDDDANGFVDDFYGYDFFYNDSNPTDDAGGHGTHTAGTIGASGNNSKGITGVNWNVKIMAVKIYSPNGTDSTSMMLVNAYNYITMMKKRGVNIRVTNNSYGGCGEACGYDQATKDALDAMGAAGILNVFAAGNGYANIDNAPAFPASYTSPSVLSVAASDASDNRVPFSNYGASSVDVAAPGASILSTSNRNDADYQFLSGTSMATPHVAGAAALLSARNPNLSAASLKATLLNTVDALPQWNGIVKSGGRLNVARALQNQTECTFAFPPVLNTFSYRGGSMNIEVTAPANCDFSVTSSASWLTVTSGNPGSGNTTVVITAGVNRLRAVRSAFITIAGQTVKISQRSRDRR